MTYPKEIDKAIAKYLEEVAAQLAELPPDEKDSILAELESHVYAALEKIGPDPTLEDLNLVLSNMAPPSSYASAPPPAPAAGTEAPERRLSRCAVAAACVAPFGVAWAILQLLVGNSSAVTPDFVDYVAWIILFIGSVAPVGSTALGLVDISQIRASGGRVIGMPLAVFMSLLYPLLLLDLLVGYMPGYAVASSVSENAGTVILGGGILLSICLDVFIFIKVWKWANRPLAPGDFA